MKVTITALKREVLLLAAITGLFLGIVLFIYQGYNIHTGISISGHSLLIRSILFALLTSIVFLSTEILIEYLKINIRLVLRRLGQTLVAGSLVFLLYNYFWQWTDLSIYSYVKLLAEFAGVMIIPLTFHFLIFRKAGDKDTVSEMLKIGSANGKQVIRIRKQDFLLAKAEDNYVKLFYLKNGNPEQHLIRATLSQIIKQINHQDVQQCHRSFVINRENIVFQEKKNSKLLVTIKGYPLPIPVSPKYQEQFAYE